MTRSRAVWVMEHKTVNGEWMPIGDELIPRGCLMTYSRSDAIACAKRWSRNWAKFGFKFRVVKYVRSK